jgi:chitodextrinase
MKIQQLQSRIKAITVLTFMLLSIGLVNLFAQSVSLPTDRGRLKIVKIADIRGGDSLLVVRTDTGTPLRGASPWIEKKQTQLSSIREGFIRDQSNAGMNAIRLVWFEAWQKGAGYAAFTDFNNPAEVAHCLNMIETYVNLCSKYGMYCIINFHSGFGFVYDEAYATQMWTVVATHFKNRTHVAFETANEPSNDFNAWMGNAEMQKYANIYNLVKTLAPNTMQIVLTPNRLPDSYPTAIDLATKFASLTPVDWKNTVVGYHLYAGALNSIRNLHKKFPALPTENNFPTNSGANKDPWGGVSLDGDYYISQTCEKLGLGWLHWAMTNDCNCYEGWYANWPLMLNDALLKSWYWQKDPFGEPDSIAPTTPTSVIADKITGNSCNLKWNVSNDEKGVSFYAVFNGTKYLGVSLTNSYVLSGLTQNTSYSITIKARDAAGNWSNASSEITVKTLENIALNKTAEASSVATTLYSAAKAVDGNASTQWRSANSDTNPTLTIDLGNFYTLNNIKLSWSTSYATSYLIEISNDGSTFTTLKRLSGQNGGDDEIVGLSATTRFVRISVKTRSATTGVYLNSAEIYGTFAWTTSASTIQFNGFEVFPNPASNSVTLKNITENAQVEILTVDGKVVYKVEKINTNALTFNLDGLNKGLYLIFLKTNNGAKLKKLVVQ